MTERRCGGCTLCCRLVPTKTESPEQTLEVTIKMIEAGMASPSDFKGMIADFDKPAGQRCMHQRHTGCSIYAKRPFGCRFWFCKWLLGADTADLRRPDRAGYVIDMMPDFVRMNGRPVEVVQIWVDPTRPDAWRKDAKLQEFIERRGLESIGAIMRFNATEATILLPPVIAGKERWIETNDATVVIRSQAERIAGVEHSREIVRQA